MSISKIAIFAAVLAAMMFFGNVVASESSCPRRISTEKGSARLVQKCNGTITQPAIHRAEDEYEVHFELQEGGWYSFSGNVKLTREKLSHTYLVAENRKNMPVWLAKNVEYTLSGVAPSGVKFRVMKVEYPLNISNRTDEYKVVLEKSGKIWQPDLPPLDDRTDEWVTFSAPSGFEECKLFPEGSTGMLNRDGYVHFLWDPWTHEDVLKLIPSVRYEVYTYPQNGFVKLKCK